MGCRQIHASSESHKSQGAIFVAKYETFASQDTIAVSVLILWKTPVCTRVLAAHHDVIMNGSSMAAVYARALRNRHHRYTAHVGLRRNNFLDLHPH
jgi:hypothetical protein